MENNPAAPTRNATEENPIVDSTTPKPAFPIIKILLIVILLLVIILVSVIAFVFGSNKTETTIATPTPIVFKTAAPTIEPVASASAAPTTKPVVTIVPTPIPTVKVNTNPNLKTFTSEALGISFDYLEVQPDYPKNKVATKVVGNKVYVNLDDGMGEGQWVEVFKKDKNDTLAQAIKKQFLQGIVEADCFVIDITSESKFPPSYKVAQISFPYDENSEIPFFSVEHKCPPGYTRTNGINFFLADTNHPDIFLFFSIGQYGINADNGQMWQGTIRFL